MAHTITKTWIIDGPNAAVLHVFFESDGVAGDLSDYVLVDPAVDFADTMAQKAGLSLNQMWYSSSWFDLKLGFEAVPNAYVWVLSRDGAGETDLRYFGGLRDRSFPDATGRLLISTLGFSPEGSVGSLVIEFRKHK